MLRQNLVLALSVVALTVATGCETKSVTPTTPDAATVAPATTVAPAMSDAAATPAKNTPDAAAPAAADGGEAPKGGGLLPDPDFTLKDPTLTAPTLGGKPSMLGGSDDSPSPEKKPRLLDTELKKE